MTDVHIPTDPYHIQATPGAASIPKLVLKHQDSFFVADRAGDFPAHFDGELGFYHDCACDLTLEIIFAADFRDLFEVRGMHRARRGESLPDQRDDGRVRLAYRGLDDIVRFTDVRFEPPPLTVASNRAV